jgi:hypothetical protein
MREGEKQNQMKGRSEEEEKKTEKEGSSVFFCFHLHD